MKHSRLLCVFLWMEENVGETMKSILLSFRVLLFVFRVHIELIWKISIWYCKICKWYSSIIPSDYDAFNSLWFYFCSQEYLTSKRFNNLFNNERSVSKIRKLTIQKLPINTANPFRKRFNYVTGINSPKGEWL